MAHLIPMLISYILTSFTDFLWGETREGKMQRSVRRDGWPEMNVAEAITVSAEQVAPVTPATSLSPGLM